ncbi:MAG: hypothetical protein JO276_03125 [Sphingomonadaceae bacterium]|nr:hypothetical protein [Sphingomonadaceae bacterium]
MRRLGAWLAAAAVLLAAGAMPAAAQRIGPSDQPLPNSPQRRALMDALRPSIEARLGKPVEFVVSQARVLDGWALVVAEPQRPGGGRIDGRRYFRDFENMDGLTVSAILRFRGGRWVVADQAIGATDVWYCGMAGPPRALTGC